MCFFLLLYRTSSDWTLVSNIEDLSGPFMLIDLEPSTSYNLQITAHNGAGFTTVEYTFVTLAARKGKIKLIFICILV